MPELPEVETIRRHLAPFVEGRVLERMEILDPLWSDPADPNTLSDAVGGRRVERLGRRGKYLIWSLEDEVHMVMHLRMTGNLMLTGGSQTPRYTRVLLRFDNGEEIAFTDPRRFGTGVVLLGDDALEDYFTSRLGVEPLSPDFTTDALRALARNRKQPVKAFLLNQERLAGVGNIYADEALFKARIHPERPVGTLKRAQLDALREAVVESLEAGIDSRGASIDDYRNPDGAEGLFQTKFQVHLREGEPCVRCGTTIKKMRSAGRGTYVCETCQPKPRKRRASAP
ncbi:MAG: formamidopyrimidine-DNA glycosylase [Thermoleophilales bacterium]|jgi:formamidopyrimidine-DNA glycosylase|nr:formamidopyrimidine-DNA glycosylase [Thermoleophilales bacterium]